MADRIVSPANGYAIVQEWAHIHEAAKDHVTRRGPLERTIWRDANGRDVVEWVTISGLGHGTPIAAGDGPNECGSAGPFLLDVGISSSYQIADYFGVLSPNNKAVSKTTGATARPEEFTRGPATDTDVLDIEEDTKTDVRSVIEKALRAAGLLR